MIISGYSFDKENGITHKLNIINNKSMPFLQYIANGLKKADGRVTTKTVKKFRVGDNLSLIANKEYVLSEIVYLNFYKSFEEMLLKEGLKNMLPFVNSFEEGIKIYNSFPGASRVKKLGCCAIGVKYISGKLNFEINK